MTAIKDFMADVGLKLLNLMGLILFSVLGVLLPPIIGLFRFVGGLGLCYSLLKTLLHYGSLTAMWQTFAMLYGFSIGLLVMAEVIRRLLTWIMPDDIMIAT